MLDVLKPYDKTTAEGLLARTSFYLNNDPVLKNTTYIKDEDAIRAGIVNEICKNLKIDPGLEDSKRKIDDYIDSELEKSMVLDKETEKKILFKLSKEGCLPTDLYQIKTEPTLAKIYHSGVENELPFIEKTVKNPDLVYNLYSSSPNQKDISIFAKYYRTQYRYNNFFLIVIGKRNGLDFIVSQSWRLYDADILRPLTNAFELLETFVEKFGVTVEFRGTTSKFFSSVIAKSETEFKVVVDSKNIKKAKGGETEVTFFHFTKPVGDGNNDYSLFFAIDEKKYKNYLATHKHKIRSA